MQEIIYRQVETGKPLTCKGLALRLAGIVIRLSLAQMLVKLLILWLKRPLCSLLFYLYAALLLARFVRDLVAGYVYTLSDDRIALESRLGDSTRERIEIPLSSVVGLRPVRRAENLRVTYRRADHFSRATAPGARLRAAFRASLVSASLARLIAGRSAQDMGGYVLAFDVPGARRACTFCPDEALLAELRARLGERYGLDERMQRARVRTLYARALERAFPAVYPYVEPLIRPEDVQWARAEIAKGRGKSKKRARRRAQPKGGKPGREEHKAPQDGAPRRRRKQG